MAKPLAVRGKFVFDPEHGGGRRRRDKHLPRQKQFDLNEDKIGYDGEPCDFKSRLGRLGSPGDSNSPLKMI